MHRKAFLGVLLSVAIIASWLILHVYGVFFLSLSGGRWALAPLLVVTLCWLDVGLFIIAHDAMHGSLAPASPRTNLWLGRLALALYAAFRFDRMKQLHMAHHEAPGSARDPDFSTEHPRHALSWYLVFMRRYFGLTEFLILSVPVAAYLALGARLENILVFWALPAVLSSLQLFFFGTFLPHRHADQPFADGHHARTNEFGTLVSLFTCFHFGYHHEHHLAPHVAWWGLPSERRRRSPARRDRQPVPLPRQR